MTVNVGTIEGGLRANVIAPEATALVNIRAPTVARAEAVARAIRSLAAFDACDDASRVRSDLGRPPMLATDRNRALFRRAQRLAGGATAFASTKHRSWEVLRTQTRRASSPQPSTGSAPWATGRTSRDEHVVVSALPERAALLALLLLEDTPPKKEASS